MSHSHSRVDCDLTSDRVRVNAQPSSDDAEIDLDGRRNGYSSPGDSLLAGSILLHCLAVIDGCARSLSPGATVGTTGENELLLLPFLKS